MALQLVREGEIVFYFYFVSDGMDGHGWAWVGLGGFGWWRYKRWMALASGMVSDSRLSTNIRLAMMMGWHGMGRSDARNNERR